MGKIIKKLFTDTETTGIDERENAVVQFAGIIEISEHPHERGDIVEEFNFFVRPFEGAVISKSALETINKTEEELFAYPEIGTTKRILTNTLSNHVNKYDKFDKYHFVAFNGAFDWRFYYSFFNRCNDPYFGSFAWYPPIEVGTIIGIKLMNERAKMKNFKQGTVAQYLDIKVEGELHDALTDVKLTRELFYWSLENK